MRGLWEGLARPASVSSILLTEVPAIVHGENPRNGDGEGNNMWDVFGIQNHIHQQLLKLAGISITALFPNIVRV